jgi:hypothetical protein
LLSSRNRSNVQEMLLVSKSKHFPKVGRLLPSVY